MLVAPFRSLMKGPTAFPEYNTAGYNTSTYAYPATEHGNEPYFNQFENIELRKFTPCGDRRVALPLADALRPVCLGSGALLGRARHSL